MNCALGIDTAGPVVGASVWVRGADEPALVWSARVVRGADGVLVPALQQMLEVLSDPAGPTAGQRLDLIGVSVGPGAFTGLRVGLATALGLAVSMECHVVSLSSLAVRASLVSAPRVLALLDARKGRVYQGWFDTTGVVPQALGLEEDVPPGVAWGLPVPTPADSEESGFVAVGEGALVFREAVANAGGVVPPGADASPAPQVARLALQGSEQAEPPGHVALRYLRPPDAQIPAIPGG